MLKVKIYVVAKSVLVFAFRTPGELPDAGWPWAAESILPSAGPAPVSGDSVPSTCVALLRVQRETCGFAFGQKEFLALKLGSTEYGKQIVTLE